MQHWYLCKTTLDTFGPPLGLHQEGVKSVEQGRPQKSVEINQPQGNVSFWCGKYPIIDDR